MKNQMLNLGILMLMILFAFSIGSLILFFNNGINNLFGIGLGVILLLVVITFISYLIFDLRSSIQDQEERDYQASEETIN